MARPNDKNHGIMASLDWWTILLYLCLLGLGWMSVCGATYDFSQQGDFFDLSTRSGMQIVWIGTSIVLGAVILLLDEKLYDTFSRVIYAAFLVLLFVTPFLAHDIKGSMSWIKIGTFSIQPAEFAKFATALCLAKWMGTYGFRMSRLRDFITSCAIILVPMLLIIKQKETGSALVYLSFFLVMYREGMTGSLLFTGVIFVAYFVIGVRFAADNILWLPATWGQGIVMLLIHLSTAGLLHVYSDDTRHARRVLWWGLGITFVAYLFAFYVIPFNTFWVQLGVCVAAALYVLYVALHDKLMPYILICVFTLGSIAFHFSASELMKHLDDHQSTRIEVLLGLKDDPRGAGYNVRQAQIAIGSGGLAGKGFLNGTQTKLKYVPEQETDFIFCTVGEEEGFMGAAGVLVLYLAFILRLIYVAERQTDAFARIYGYSVLSIFLFHVFINVGMVLGLTPVIGIPLPFFSYGGSSLWGFTILLFILLRLDAARYIRQQH